ncbi:MAG: polyhydroxyalkanoate synthesis regulator DNA-binding domain-containing protein [Myxococcota bacterium]
MPVTIKKYPNRRLYDTNRSAYVNLEQVAELVRSGVDLRVIDAKDGADRTKDVLLQIVLEVLDGADLLPLGMLRRLIRATGTGPAELLLRRQLATGLELMSAQLDRMEALVSPPPPPPPAPSPPPSSTPSTADVELDELRQRLTDLERRLSRS